jgi:hypothetical protein
MMSRPLKEGLQGQGISGVPHMEWLRVSVLPAHLPPLLPFLPASLQPCGWMGPPCPASMGWRCPRAPQWGEGAVWWCCVGHNSESCFKFTTDHQPPPLCAGSSACAVKPTAALL